MKELTAAAKKQIAGKNGEKEIFAELQKDRDKILIPDYLYAFDSAFAHSSHQIDHVVITDRYIYLVEVKSYRKILDYGFDRDTWTLEYHKTGTDDRRRNGIDNPVRQNRNHRSIFKQLVPFVPAAQILAVSVVLSETDLTDGRRWHKITDTDFIVRPDCLRDFIAACDARCSRIIEREEVARTLYAVMLPAGSKWQHIRYCGAISAAKKIIKNNKNYPSLEDIQFAAQTCPVCGSKMYVRNGGSRLFWGCSSYPECKTTVRILK